MKSNWKIGITILAAAAALFFTIPAGAEDGEDARETLHREAYVAIVKAEQARDEGSYANSIELFAAGLDMYRQIARDFPGWRSRIVEARIPYCINELKSLLERDDMKVRFGAKLKPLMDAPLPRYVESGRAAQPEAGEEVEPSAPRERIDAGGESPDSARLVEELLREKPTEENRKARERAMEEAAARNWSASASKSGEEAARVASKGLTSPMDTSRELKQLRDDVAVKERDLNRLREKCVDLQKDLDEAQRTAEKYRKEAKPRTATQRERDLEKELERLRGDMFQMAQKQLDAGRDGKSSSAGIASRASADTARLEKECAGLRAENEDLRSRCDEALSAKAGAEKRAEQLAKAASSGSGRDKDLAAEVEKLRAQLRDATSERARSKRTDPETEGLRKELTDVTGQYARLKAVSDKLRKQYDELLKQKDTAGRAVGGAASASSASGREKDLLNEIARLRGQVYDLTSQKTGKDAGDKRKQDDKYADKRYDVLKAEYDRVSDENEDLKARLASEAKRAKKSKPAPEPQTQAAPAKAPVKAVRSARPAPAPEAGRALSDSAARRVVVEAQPASPAPAASAKGQAQQQAGAGEQDEAGAKIVGLIKENKLADARAMLDTELVKLPDDPDLMYLYGMLYCKQGEFANAAKILKHVADVDPTDARARVALGGAYIGMRDYVNARMELEMAVGFDPDMAEAHYDLAQVLLVGAPSDPQGASDQYNDALKLGAQPDPAFEAKLARALGKKVAPQGK